MTRSDSADSAGTADGAKRQDTATTSGGIAPAENTRTWTIAQVAQEFNITHRTVRHYEELNLISPERRGTARIYHRRDRTRLNLILRGKRLGFPLEEIRTIIDLYDEPTGQTSQLSYVLDQIHDRRGHLERRRADIDDALSELDAFERRCQSDLTRLRGRTELSPDPPSPASTQVTSATTQATR